MAFREVYCRESGEKVYRQLPGGGYEPDTVEHIESATMGSTIDWDKVERANKRSRKARLSAQGAAPGGTLIQR